jgi:hypothetical protein
VLVRREECILNRILRVGCIAQEAISTSKERCAMARKNILYFTGCAFAVENVEERFASDVCLCLLHVALSSWQHSKEARRFPIKGNITLPPVFNGMRRFIGWKQAFTTQLKASGD